MTAPCAVPSCPALATRGDYCAIHVVAALRTVCAWCHAESSPGVEPVSHGACADCAARVRQEMVEQAEAYEQRMRIKRLYGRPRPAAR